MPHITELEDCIKNDTLSIQHKKFLLIKEKYYLLINCLSSKHPKIIKSFVI